MAIPLLGWVASALGAALLLKDKGATHPQGVAPYQDQTSPYPPGYVNTNPNQGTVSTQGAVALPLHPPPQSSDTQVIGTVKQVGAVIGSVGAVATTAGASSVAAVAGVAAPLVLGTAAIGAALYGIMDLAGVPIHGTYHSIWPPEQNNPAWDPYDFIFYWRGLYANLLGMENANKLANHWHNLSLQEVQSQINQGKQVTARQQFFLDNNHLQDEQDTSNIENRITQPPKATNGVDLLGNPPITDRRTWQEIIADNTVSNQQLIAATAAAAAKASTSVTAMFAKLGINISIPVPTPPPPPQPVTTVTGAGGGGSAGGGTRTLLN